MVVVAYWPLLRGSWEFIMMWDDDGNFFKNPMVLGLSPTHLWSMLTESYINVYEPLSFLEKALALRAFPPETCPQAFRLFVLTFHAAAAWLASRCTLELISMHHTTASLSQTAREIGAAFAGTAYAIHPQVVEVIGWPSAGPYAPACAFAFAAALYYIQSIRRDSVSLTFSDLPPWVGALSLPVALFTLSMLHKSVAILLPVALVGIDVALRQGPDVAKTPAALVVKFILHSLLRKAALLLVSVAFILPMLLFNEHNKAFGSHADVEQLTGVQRVVLSCLRFWLTFVHGALPGSLRPHYRIPSGMVDLPFLSPPSESITEVFTGVCVCPRDVPECCLCRCEIVTSSACCAGEVSARLAKSVGLTFVTQWAPRAEPLMAVVATAVAAVWVITHVREAPLVFGAAWFYAVIMLPVCILPCTLAAWSLASPSANAPAGARHHPPRHGDADGRQIRVPAVCGVCALRSIPVCATIRPKLPAVGTGPRCCGAGRALPPLRAANLTVAQHRHVHQLWPQVCAPARCSSCALYSRGVMCCVAAAAATAAAFLQS